MTDDWFMRTTATDPAEIERHKHVRGAVADSRLAGFPPPRGVEREILEAYIRGEIAAGNLIDVLKKRLGMV